MIYDLRFTIDAASRATGSRRREEALLDCGWRIPGCGAEGIDCAEVLPNGAKRLECVVFSDALRRARGVMTTGALARAVLKPPQSRRFATSEALLSLAPGFSPVIRAGKFEKPLKRFCVPRTSHTGLKAGVNERGLS
jgi:hypothetical protein